MYTQSEVVAPTDNRAKKRFLFFSLIGLLLFITPIPWNGEWGVGVGILAGILKSFLPVNTLPTVALFIVVFSSLVTATALILNPKSSKRIADYRKFFYLPKFGLSCG